MHTDQRAIKVLQTDPQKAVVAGYGIVFHTRDLAGDMFLPTTDFGLTRDCKGIPVYYDHAMGNPKDAIGRVIDARQDAAGLWFALELDRHQAYVDEVLKLVDAGALGLSTGALAHLVRREQGVLKTWIIGELSLTPTPCEPATLPVTPMKTTPEEMTTTMEHTTPETDVYTRIDQLEATVKTLLEAPALPRNGFVLPGDAAVGGRDGRAQDDGAVKAFERYVRTGVKAALQEGTPGEGGYLVPTQYSDQMIAALKDMSILRAAGARVLRVSGANSFKVPTITNSSAAVLTAEEAAFNESEPTFAEITFTPWKYTRLAKASDELLVDSRFDVMSQVLIPDFAQAFAAAENSAFTSGTGSGQPQGVVAGGTVVDTAATGTFTADDIITLYHSLNYLYRQRAVWLMNDLVAKVVRTFKEATTGQYLWQPGLQAGQPDRLLGRPVYTLNTMDSGTTTAGQKILVFGDLSYYWIVDFGGEAMKRLDELYAATGQVGFRAYRRVDGRVMLGAAIQVLRVKA